MAATTITNIHTDRAVWRTTKHRAQDLALGDVIRNTHGKWDVVTDVQRREDGRYIDVHFECGLAAVLRTVALVDVQTVKPS